MGSVTIQDVGYQVSPLSATQLLQWQCFIAALSRRRYWIELNEEIAALPMRQQEIVVARSAPPRELSNLGYFALASRAESVEYLLGMTKCAPRPPVTEHNAAEIFMALQPLILDKPVVLSGGDALNKLREEARDAE